MRAEPVAPRGREAYVRAVRGMFHPKADIDLPDETLRRLPIERAAFAASAVESVARAAGDLLGGPVRAVASVADRGTYHAVFLLEAEDGRGLVARVGLPLIPWPSLDFAIGSRISEALGRRGVPVPRVHVVDTSRSHHPFDFEISAAALGTPLPPGPGDHAALHDLGAVLARLHGVRCAGFGPLDPGPPGGDGRPKGVHSRWSDFVLLRLDEHLRVCREASALDRGAAAAVEGVFARAEAFLADTPGALLHGDLGNGNVLVAGARLTALIDWEDCLSGDPVFDLAGWGSFVGNHERRRRLLAGYTAEAALPDDFELRYALYTLRILLARTVHRHRFGYSRTDRIPAASRLRPAVEAVAARLGSPG